MRGPIKLPMKHVPVAIATFALLIAVSTTAGAEYDPSVLPADRKRHATELTFNDAGRKREIPVRVYLPVTAKPAPVVLYSHGLGGTRHTGDFLAEHWSARGYVVVLLQHPGSDDSVWRNAEAGQRLDAMRQAASGENMRLRVDDVRAVLDQLELWNKQPQHELSSRLDLQHIGMSGHSFGAVTTQAVSGQSFGPAGPRLTDPRIKAALAFSPSTPRAGDTKAAFGSVKIPWMLMTGTKDAAPIGGQTVEMRLAVYPVLPAGIEKYELVFKDAEHSAFTDRALPGDKQPRNPNHHRAILALSTAFWDVHLRDDTAARDWLHGPAARSVLEDGDLWQLQAGR
jgi:predicted dienelactone hydrolase